MRLSIGRQVIGTQKKQRIKFKSSTNLHTCIIERGTVFYRFCPINYQTKDADVEILRLLGDTGTNTYVL